MIKTQDKLFAAVKSGEDDLFKELIKDFTGSINFQDHHQRTMLHYVAIFFREEICKILLEKGINANIKDKNGKAAIRYASQFSRLSIATSLINYGAKINIIDNNFKSPLHCAVEKRAVASVKLLVEAGASYHNVDDEGFNSIHIAHFRGFKEIEDYFYQTYKNRCQNFKRMIKDENDKEEDERPSKIIKVTDNQLINSAQNQRY